MSLKSLIKKSVCILLACLTIGCGSGSSGSNILIEGTLTEGAGIIHSSMHQLRNESCWLKHSAGQRIEEVEICALGKCSTTNLEGEWGFFVSEIAVSPVEFSIKGHGIDTFVAVELEQANRHVFIHFEHVEGAVSVHHMFIDNDHHKDDHHEHDHDHKHDHDNGHAHAHGHHSN
jgi:hypothetical protein